MKALKKITATLSICTIISGPAAFANYSGCELPDSNSLPEALRGKVCSMVKAKESVVLTKKETLNGLRELQGYLMQGRILQEKINSESELTAEEQLAFDLARLVEGSKDDLVISDRVKNRIINAADEIELLNVQEDISNEIGDLSLENSTQLTKSGASLGGIVLFSYLISRSMRTTRGQALTKRIMTQIFDKKRLGRTFGVNVGLVFSLVVGAYSSLKFLENREEQTNLNKMIQVINSLKIQAGHITELEEEVDELEACYWLQVDQLLDKGLAKESESGLQCL